jgi:hypothetical protein
MRTTVGALGGVVMLFVGLTGLSLAAERSKDHAYNASNASQEAWNLTTQTFGGIGEGALGGWALMAIGAVVLVATALTVSAARGKGGGR